MAPWRASSAARPTCVPGRSLQDQAALLHPRGPGTPTTPEPRPPRDLGTPTPRYKEKGRAQETLSAPVSDDRPSGEGLDAPAAALRLLELHGAVAETVGLGIKRIDDLAVLLHARLHAEEDVLVGQRLDVVAVERQGGVFGGDSTRMLGCHFLKSCNSIIADIVVGLRVVPRT